jgi:hypothetical protein
MKQSFFLTLALSLLFSATISRAAILPIAKGDGIWNVATRIASELATITLDTPSCSFPLHQSDIGFGGTFVITASNAIYCLDENITITFGSAIRIAGSGITLDLSGKIIDGQNFATTGIELAGGVQNVTIKNGIIRRMGGAAPNGTAIRDTVGITRTLKNIVIKDMNFSNNNVSAISINNATAPTPDYDGLLIENCRAFNSGIIRGTGNSAFIQGCDISEFRSGKTGGISFQGVSVTRPAEHLVVQDCVFTGTSPIANGVLIQNVQDVIVQNCIMQGGGSGSHGVGIFGYGQALVSNCYIQNLTGITNGMALFGAFRNGVTTVSNCFVDSVGRVGIEVTSSGGTESLSVNIIDCIVHNSRNWGILVAEANAGGTRQGINIKRCQATNCGSPGFGIIQGNVGSILIEKIVIEDCISQDNNGDGFAISVRNAPSTSTRTIVFRNCVAQRNRPGNDGVSVTYRGDGFGIGTGSTDVGRIFDVILENCIAQGNFRDGFSFASTTSNVVATNCFSMNNVRNGFTLSGSNNFTIGCMATGNVTDFVGVSDLTQVISYSTAGAINGIGRFVNVSS